MKITRSKGMESGYDYEFVEDNKTFSIIFGGNLDLYWSLTTNQEFTSYEDMIKELYDTFTITKENYQIYSLFKTLIDEIKSSKVYLPSPECVVTDDDEVVFVPPSYNQIVELNQTNEDLKAQAGYKRILEDGVITWHSDDEPYKIADVLQISEQDDKIILEFYRPELTDDKFSLRQPGTISIRFRNSGSYYLPFNIVFMRMYNKLQEFDPDLDHEYHQIHFEELPYQLKKKQEFNK